MKITGLAFAGTRTPRRAEMAAFLRDVLRLDASLLPGVDTDVSNFRMLILRETCGEPGT